jgi:hypothetical protein
VKFKPVIISVVMVGILSIPLHNFNLGKLLSSVEKSESTMEGFIFRDVPTRVTNEAGTLVYCLGGKLSSDCSWDAETVWNYWVENILSRDAEKVRQQLMIDKVNIERIDIFPLFGNLNDAKERYLDHVDAWISYTESFARCENILCYNNIPKSNNVSPSFRIAETYFNDAIWIVDLPNLKDRVKIIFND